MGFEKTDGCRADAGLLRGAVKRAPVDLDGGSAGVDAAAAGGTDSPHHCVNAVAVGESLVQPFQHYGHGTLARQRAVGAAVEGPHSAARRAGPDSLLGRDAAQLAAEVHRARQHGIELPGLEGAHANLQRPHARGFPGGHHEAGSAEAECARDAAGHHAAQGAQRAVGGEGRAAGLLQTDEPLQGLWVVEPARPGLSPFGEALLQEPAQVETGGLEIEVDSDHGPRARAILAQR